MCLSFKHKDAIENNEMLNDEHIQAVCVCVFPFFAVYKCNQECSYLLHIILYSTGE